jgi:hypothetical protein
VPNPLASFAAYEEFVYGLRERYPSVLLSTLVYIPSGTLFGRLDGILVFAEDLCLCVQEFLNFELGIIEGYGYEVSRPALSPRSPDFPAATEYCRASYPQKDKLYWYDSFPHPNDPALAIAHPHHKHVAPDIKRHRVPATELSFTRPNLPYLIEEIERHFLSVPGST